MLPLHAMVMEAALMMEIAYVTTVSMQQIAQVNFFCISEHQNMFCNLKCFVWLVECDAGQKCSGQGICGPDGACECDVGFYAEECSSKLKIWYFVLNTVLIKIVIKKNCCEFEGEGQELICKTNLFKQGKVRIILETEYQYLLQL